MTQDGFLKQLITVASGRTIISDVVRTILEAGFKGEKKVLQEEKLQACARVLDLGCGSGLLCKPFSRSSYVGIDLNKRFVMRAASRNPGIPFLQMDGRNLGFKSGVFDAALISGVLHHVNDEDAIHILRECRRVLRKNVGKIVVWEDVPVRRKGNLIGRLVHSLDNGAFIRPEDDYIQLFKSVFEDFKHYPMTSGVCDYEVLVARV